MRKSLRVLRYVAVFFIALAIACLGVMWLSDPFPVRSLAQPSGGLEKAWWLQPQPLSPSEVSAQQWLADTTCRLPPEREKEVWDVGGNQHGNFSIRYQVAFAGYAAAALGMRTPAYVGLTRRVISNTVARVADRKAWSYIQSYWSREAWFPDPCACGN